MSPRIEMLHFFFLLEQGLAANLCVEVELFDQCSAVICRGVGLWQ